MWMRFKSTIKTRGGMRHPTEVDERDTIRRKHAKASKCTDRYTFAFSRSNYCDVEIFNISGNPTTSSKGFRDGFATLFHPGAKPVVFFLCYDVGFKEGPGRFVRHVVCCIATRAKESIHVLGFDMRNLREISNDLRSVLIRELSHAASVPPSLTLHYTNIACVERNRCVYLQRYKHHTDIGWCIAWALFFLEVAICAPIQGSHYASDLSVSEQTHAFASLYRLINRELTQRKTNGFIEEWFAAELKG